MTWNVTPAINRQWTWVDNEPTVLDEVASDITFTRGLGQHGKRAELVDKECPVCGHDRMIREISDQIDSPQFVAYWCLNPSCEHFVADTLDWATGDDFNMPERAPVRDEVAVCPDCEDTHRIPINETTPGTYNRRDEFRTETRTLEDVPLALCDRCRTNRAEEEAGV